MVRHEHSQILGGRPITELPAKTEEVRTVTLPRDERDAYAKVVQGAKAKFEEWRRLVVLRK